MESGPGLSVPILDYQTLLQHYSSLSSQQGLPSERRMRRSGSRHSMTPTPVSRSEIVPCNYVEAARPHAVENQELCLPRGELTVGDIDDSSSTSAEGFGQRRGLNDRILKDSSSAFGDLFVDNSLKSEEALAKERDLLVAEGMASLGPGGCGLLAVRGVPEVTTLRKRLLPLAKKLALMPDATRRPVLKSYGLNTDVPLKRPDRPVSAFATKLHYARHSHATDGSCISPPFSKCSPGCLCDVSNSKDLSSENENRVSGEHSDLEQLGCIVRQLGACMVEVGLLVARLCDSTISGADLEDAIWESGSVKARLIHYHAYSEKDLLSHPAKMVKGFSKKGMSRKLSKSKTDFEDTIVPWSQSIHAIRTPANPCSPFDIVNRISEELWQEWHYDYGILTVLTAPMFLLSPSLGSTYSIPECESYPGGHTCLTILSRGVEKFVSVPPDCLIVQVGEAAQIVSGGKLAAVAHCVSRPPSGQIDISREMFVTFLQPAWDRVLSPPVGVTRAEVLNLEPFHKGSTTFVKPKENKEELLRENRADLVCSRPLYISEEEDCERATILEVRNIDLVDRFPEFLSQSKQGKTDTETTGTEVSNYLIQGLSTVEFGALAPEAPVENFFSQEGSGRANKVSEQHVKLSTVVPSLDSRWKEGCTFAEFSRETTAQYYGAHGRQSQRIDNPL